LRLVGGVGRLGKCWGEEDVCGEWNKKLWCDIAFNEEMTQVGGTFSLHYSNLQPKILRAIPGLVPPIN